MSMKPCPHCGASMKHYRHSLNKGLAIGLLKLARTNGGTAMLRHLNLTTVQFNNFQKLQYWGLVKRNVESHEWSITERGIRFVKNEISIRKTVITFRSDVQSREGENVTISALMKQQGGYWWRQNYLDFAL